jgi:hypothetical protein
LNITDITAPADAFFLDGFALPLTLAPSETATVSVAFWPTLLGPASGEISIVSDASSVPTAVTVSGTGIDPTPPPQRAVELNWAATSAVSGYNVYRSTVSGSGYTKTNSALLPDLFYTDPAADSGTTYYYVVTAVDSAAVESDYSVEVAVAVP